MSNLIAKSPNSNEGLVSIVIPTFNQGNYIGECIKSICEQTYKNIEIIIQDSCSTDRTEAVCREWATRDNRIQYIREKDAGQSDAINRGLSRAKGLYFNWLCSDDYYWSNNAIEKLVAVIVSAATSTRYKIEGAFGRAQTVNEFGKVEGEYRTVMQNLTAESFKYDWPLSQPASMWLKEAFDRVAGVDLTLHLGMDLDLFIRILKSGGQLVYIDHPIACVRNQPNSKSVALSFETTIVAFALTRRYFGNLGNLKKSVYGRQLKGYFPIRFPRRLKIILGSYLSGPMKKNASMAPEIAKQIIYLRQCVMQAAFPEIPKMIHVVPQIGFTRFPWIPFKMRMFLRKYFLNPLGVLPIAVQIAEQHEPNKGSKNNPLENS